MSVVIPTASDSYLVSLNLSSAVLSTRIITSNQNSKSVRPALPSLHSSQSKEVLYGWPSPPIRYVRFQFQGSSANFCLSYRRRSTWKQMLRWEVRRWKWDFIKRGELGRFYESPTPEKIIQIIKTYIITLNCCPYFWLRHAEHQMQSIKTAPSISWCLHWWYSTTGCYETYFRLCQTNGIQPLPPTI